DRYIKPQVMLVLVNRIVYDNAFLVDYSIGFGFGFSEESNFSEPAANQFERSYHYGFFRSGG
ncbi:MAG: hypothetical protein AAFX57_08200, partial [Bacteroidota bacterium]